MKVYFKGKRIDNDEWIYGDLVYDNENQPRIVIDREYSTGTTFVCQAPRVIAETVSQFTGFWGKHFKRIYENDFVKFNNKIGVVCFENGCFGIGFNENINYTELSLMVKKETSNNGHWLYCDNFISFYEIIWNFNEFGGEDIDEIEVIGNKYDAINKGDSK